MTTFGYSRVSTRLKQKHDRQLKALKEHGITEDYIFQDNATGANADRPGLRTMIKALREGDTVVVCELARLGRSLKDLNAICGEFKERGVIFVSLKEKIDTTTAIGRFSFNMIASIAEFERELIVERVRAGVQIAKERGHYKGSTPKLNEKDIARLKRLYSENQFTSKQLAGMFGVGRSTIYRYLKS